jgi:hypothetical protein
MAWEIWRYPDIVASSIVRGTSLILFKADPSAEERLKSNFKLGFEQVVSGIFSDLQ